ncbi:ATP-binding protein [Oleiagrimonas sp. C23AA]|uniref:sensor histidine kinase n=1 Tax=Oleiagrimonas sp. C23AA TaxID=2719047 RepID=UPI00141EAE91|nr:ATP-binding protein [Oleiagrimonas sp. C23AA]NII10974.1 DUF4118 domain-containing protein [Oleiagrimonas sp. C23AA]
MNRPVPDSHSVRFSERATGLASYAYASAVTLVAFANAFIADRYMAIANLSLIFLTAIMVVAVRVRMRVAAYAAILCFLGYNFFFTQPRYTFAIDSADDVLTVSLFLVAALICSRLATQLAEKVASLRTARASAEALHILGKQLAEAGDQTTIHRVAADTAARLLERPVAILVRPTLKDPWQVAMATPSWEPLDAHDALAADYCDRLAEPTGNGTERIPAATCLMLPMCVDKQRQGVLAVACPQRPLSPEARYLAHAMAQDVAQALERIRLAEALEKARVAGETERLRNALLSSVSHDLRSPLSAMIGSAQTLSRYGRQLPEEEHQQLLEGVLEEGLRLDRYIQNLLDMARLGHGELPLRRDWVDVADIVAAAVERIRTLFPGQPMDTELPSSTLLLHVHPALIEQALFNVLENAVHVSPSGVPVHLRVYAAGARLLLIDVSDQGPGIAADQRERVFDAFYSVARGDRGAQGTGLGLSICRGLVGAHGGTVEALAATPSGTMMRISLPLPALPEEHE